MEHSGKTKGKTEIYPLLSISKANDTHMEELDSVQKFTEMQSWLLLIFSICLHNQLSSFNYIIVQMSEKRVHT